MAQKCFMLSFENCGGQKGTGFICLESISTVPGGCGVILVYNGVPTGISERSAFWSVVNSDNPALCPPDYPFLGGSCDACKSIAFDCINGVCTDSSTFKTPGKYSSLTSCESSCSDSKNSCAPPFQCIDPSNFCPPGKVCVPQDEWGQIVGLVSQNVSKHCH